MYAILLQTMPTAMEFTTGPASAPATQSMSPMEGVPLSAIVIAAVITLLIMGWIGVRYYLGTTRPSGIKEIETPSINRLNANALEHMVGESAEEAEAELEAKKHEAAPDDLLAAVPPEEVEIKADKPPEAK